MSLITLFLDVPDLIFVDVNKASMRSIQNNVFSEYRKFNVPCTIWWTNTRNI